MKRVANLEKHKSWRFEVISSLHGSKRKRLTLCSQGEPMLNDCLKSSNGRMREEPLNETTLRSLANAQLVIAA